MIEGDDQFALLALMHGWAGGDPGLVVGASEADFDRAGVEDFEAVLVGCSRGDLLGPEAGVGVVHFDELDGSSGVVDDVGLDESGATGGEREAGGKGGREL